MRATARTARWTVTPNREHVGLIIDGIPYTMTPDEADALSDLLDQTVMFVRNRNITN